MASREPSRRRSTETPMPRGGLARSLLATTLWAGLAGGAMAQTVLNFDDLNGTTGGKPMPASYQSLSFANTQWHAMSLAAAPADTFLALSGSATGIRKADGSAFVFEGADFWSRRGLDANGEFYYVLSLKGRVVYDGRQDKRAGRMRFTGTRTLLPPAYSGAVDHVAIAFAKPGKGGDWDQLAMDNLRLRAAP